MKEFFKKLDKIVAIILLVCILAGGVYIGFINPDALKSSYTIKLNSNGIELENDSFSAKRGNHITLPEPTREGYVFDGWYNGDTKWNPAEDVITGDIELTARWVPTKHAITFVVEGVEYTESYDYDSVPEFKGTPTKSPSVSEEYIFSGWAPEISTVKGTATYTATFTKQTRKYNISVSSTFVEAANISGAGAYEYNSDATISLNVNNGYNFLGWYKNGSFYSLDTTLQFNNIAENINLEAQFSIIKRSISYLNTFSTPVNPTAYDISYGTFELYPQQRNGYKFMGWFTGPDGSGNEITHIDSSLLTDYTLYAHYELKTYTITYNLDGGTLTTENPSVYSITTESFTLNNPTKENHNFLGWIGTGLNTATENVTIENGSFGDRTYTAIWQPIYVYITLNVDGMELSEDILTVQHGSTITFPNLDTSKYGMSGYYVSTWYTDASCINLFDPTTKIKSSQTLYGKWTYIIDNGFYNYKIRFDTALDSGSLLLLNSDTEDTLVKWIEYLSFYNITSDKPINIVFSNAPFVISDSNENTFKQKVNAIINKSTFPSEHSIGYSYSQSGESYKLSYLYCVKDDAVVNGSLVSDPEKTNILTQLNYGLLKSSSGREESFDEFNIDNVVNTLTVSTSNQLVYALEKGLNPICISGSNAEIIYNKAKEILKDIIDDDMSDLDKIRAIYDWLIQNVNYDHHAVDNSAISNSWENYDSWYAEGVFNNYKAVCDGYAKALLILAKIENIPTIRVTGNEHAWNKVLINCKWYGIDATHGDITIGSNEVHTYTSFLFTDTQKAANGYTSASYPSILASQTFNYYEYEEYTYSSSTADLLINSYDEFNTLMSVLALYEYNSVYVTIEIAIAADFYSTISDSFGDKMNSLFYNPSETHSFTLHSYSYHETDAFNNHIYTLLIY